MIGKSITVLVSGLVLSACGGGGGGGGDSASGVAYTGAKTPAVITDVNAPELAADSLGGSAYGTSATSVFGVVTDPADQTSRPINLSIGRAIAQAATHVELSANAFLPGAVQTDTGTIPCDSGSAAYTIRADDQTGAASGSFNFQNCLSMQVRLSGSVTFSGHVNLSTQELTDMTVTFDSFAADDGADSLTMYGDVDYTFSAQSVTMVMNVLLRDDNSGEIAQLEDYRVGVTDNGAQYSMTITGRVYHPEHGYVTLNTTSPLITTYNDAWPYSGQLAGTGNSSSFRATCTSPTEYTLEVDADGDGSYETVTSETW